MGDALRINAKHLHEVEKLSIRQVAVKLGIGRKKAARLLSSCDVKKEVPVGIINPYERLIGEWYSEYPFLRATQAFERLKSYGYTGGYGTVKEYTIRYRRKKKRESFHELEFLPGEEAQVDWMQWSFPFGVVYGFAFILSYSRYLYARFYPKASMEFFLDGHISALKEISGCPRRMRYDNLKSVVIKRKPEIAYNTQFLDFARHYGFAIHACNPGKGNEKGRVERVIRDMEEFIKPEKFSSIDDLNKRFSVWRIERNKRIHRTTGKKPAEAILEERLKTLPAIPYKAYRCIPAHVTKTGFVDFETNRYSVPSSCSQMTGTILAYPEHLEIVIKDKRVASHKRSFGRQEKIENPSHRERILDRTNPEFKQKRIYQLMMGMDESIRQFLNCAEEEGEDILAASYTLFSLLRTNAKESLVSAVREAVSGQIYKASYIQSLLQPKDTMNNPVRPQNHGLLEINYKGRELSDYDKLI